MEILLSNMACSSHSGLVGGARLTVLPWSLKVKNWAPTNVSSMMVANFVVATKLGDYKLNTNQCDKHDEGQFCSGHQFWLAASGVLECPHERRCTITLPNCTHTERCVYSHREVCVR